MSDTKQIATFADTNNREYSFAIDGATIRPARQLIKQVLSGASNTEYRLDVTEGGLRVRSVDASNVIMVDMTLPAQQFTSYDVDSTTLGIPDKQFGKALQHARYGAQTSDVLFVEGNGTEFTTTVERPISGTEVMFSERMQLLDPDSIRDEPDIPELDFDAKAELPANTLTEVLKRMDTTSKSAPIEFRFGSGGLLIGQENTEDERAARIACDIDGTSESLFSTDYIERIQKALRVGRADSVVLKNSPDFPLEVQFERENTYSGTIMLSPRVRSD